MPEDRTFPTLMDSVNLLDCYLVKLPPERLQISELYRDLKVGVPHPVVQIGQSLLLLLGNKQ